jgi:hypothetical protein
LDPVCGPFGAFSLRKSDNGIDEGESSIGTTSSTFTVIGAALDSAEFPIYYWGDGTASAENTSGTASHTYTASGVYHLTQDAVSAQNSLATDIVGTYVTIADSSPTFSWVSNLPGNALIAQTQATFLTGSESGYTNCHWDWGDGTTLDYCSPSVLHTFAMAGNYTVSLTLSNPGQDIGPNAGSEIVIVVPPAVLTGVSGNIIGFPTSVDETGAPLNYWASIQGLCTLKVSGDPYATKVTTSVPANCGTAATTNSEYYQPAVGAPGAYNYLINVQTPGPVVVDLYDPQFCPRASSNFNTGDTNFSGSSNFNTAFTLYGPSSTPTDPSDDQVMTAVSYPGDGSTSTNDGWGGATHSCSSYYVSGTNGNYTGKWLNFATFNAPSPGVYRLNVKTSSTVGNRADGNNQFALRTSSNGGSGTQPIITATTANDSPLLSGMITISSSGNHEIRLAQVDASAAGHTLEIDLFDPGDCTASTSISLETPTTNGYQTATVNWRDAGLTLGSSGTLHYGVSSISTSNGSAFFNGHWLVVTIAIPADYTAPQGGWLKLKYNTSGTWQDRLTWQASLQN